MGELAKSRGDRSSRPEPGTQRLWGLRSMEDGHHGVWEGVASVGGSGRICGKTWAVGTEGSWWAGPSFTLVQQLSFGIGLFRNLPLLRM